LSVQFSPPKQLNPGHTNNNNASSSPHHQQPNIHMTWLNVPVHPIDHYFSAASNHKKSLNSYSSYLSSNLKEFGLKSSTFAGTNSIGIIGDLSKQSYFGIEMFQLKNYDVALDTIEYEFESANPRVVEFDSYDRLARLANLDVIGQPQIVDSRYGKSVMLANADQRLTFTNISHECFGNMNACKNGYTVKLWFCLTNYNSQMYKNANGYDIYFFKCFLVKRYFDYSINEEKMTINWCFFLKILLKT
jgi:hypothetical protein